MLRGVIAQNGVLDMYIFNQGVAPQACTYIKDFVSAAGAKN